VYKKEKGPLERSRRERDASPQLLRRMDDPTGRRGIGAGRTRAQKLFFLLTDQI